MKYVQYIFHVFWQQAIRTTIMPAKTSDAITTTQLARNLAAAIDKVRIERQPLAITRGSRTVAELNPPRQGGYPVADLARLLASLPGLGNDAKAMATDLARIRATAALPENPWAS